MDELKVLESANVLISKAQYEESKFTFCLLNNNNDTYEKVGKYYNNVIFKSIK